MSQNIYINRNLLHEYTLILAKQKSVFGSYYFAKQENGDPQFGYDVFKMAIEIFLRWTPEQALKRLTPAIIKKMRLDLVMPYMQLPPECLFNDDYTWILHTIYPDHIPYNEEDCIISIYDKILKGEKYKWPKWYFSNAEGHARACVCLRYMIEHVMSYDSLEELYDQFASGEGLKMINKYGLKNVVFNEFGDPVTFLHETLSAEERQIQKYHYYKTKYYYLKAQKEQEKLAKLNK